MFIFFTTEPEETAGEMYELIPGQMNQNVPTSAPPGKQYSIQIVIVLEMCRIILVDSQAL